MATADERRKHRRYDLSLELHVRPRSKRASPAVQTYTRDISARGIYFGLSEQMTVGSELDLELTLPPELCAGKNVRIRCRGRIVRLEKPDSGTAGIAATIESYEFIRND